MANIKKNATGYGYKYTDLAAINDYIESIGETYYQETETVDGVDYIVTVRRGVKDTTFPEQKEIRIRGSRVIQASLSGKNNPAQEQGSGLTYARRYSLLMAYGLATEDDDGQSLKVKTSETETTVSKKDTDTLRRAKTTINAALINQNYITSDSKIAFIRSVLMKDSIDSIDDADLVMDAIDDAQIEPVEPGINTDGTYNK